MGLDMYLTKKTFIGSKYSHRNVVVKSLDIEISGKPVKVNNSKLDYIGEEVAYWRKANQIHNWFVENVQNGQDDCGNYDVSIEQLKKLLDLCKQVQQDHSKAEELLPTSSGFFFGTTEYDDWYFEQINDTIEEIQNIIDEHDDESEIHYEYQSSW